LVPAYRDVKVTSQTASRLAKSGELPANVKDGDYVICAVSFNGSPGTVTTPIGWTALTALITVASNPQLQVFGRFWEEGDPMTVVVATSTANAGAIVCSCYSGVDPITPMDATPVTGGSATAGLSHTNTGITTVTANALVVGVNAANSSTATFTTASLTERWDTGAQKAQTGGTLSVASPSATGVITWTCSASLAFANAVLALRPDPQRSYADVIVTGDAYALVRRRGRQVTPGFRGPGDTTSGNVGGHPRFGAYAAMVLSDGVAAAGGTTFNQTVAAVSGSVASLVSRVGKVLATPSAAVASRVAQVGKSVAAAAVGSVASVAKRASVSVAASASSVATVVRRAGKTLVASSTVAATLNAARVVLVTLTAVSVASASVVRRTGKVAVTQVSGTASRVVQVGKQVAGLSVSAAVLSATRVVFMVLTAVSSAAPAVVRRALKTVAAVSPVNAVISRQTGKTVSASSLTTAALVRSANKTLSATSVVSAVLSAIRVFLVTLATTAGSSAASMVRRTGKTVVASVSSTATLLRSTLKTIAVASPVSASISATRLFLKVLAASAGSAATVARRTGKTVAAASTAASSMVKRVSRTVAVVCAASSSIVKQVWKRVTATSNAAVTLDTLFSSVTAPVFLAAFDAPRPRSTGHTPAANEFDKPRPEELD